MVRLEGEHVIATPSPDLGGDLPLAAHGVNGHRLSGQVQAGQQRGERRDFVVLGLDGLLGEDQALRRRPGADEVERPGAGERITGAADRFPVEGDHLGLGRPGHGLHPAQEPGLELARIEPGEDPANGVVGGNPVRQIEPVGQPVLLDPAPLGDLDPGFGATDHRADGDRHDVEQAVPAPMGNPGVDQVTKTVANPGRGMRQHGGTPGRRYNRSGPPSSASPQYPCPVSPSQEAVGFRMQSPWPRPALTA